MAKSEMFLIFPECDETAQKPHYIKACGVLGAYTYKQKIAELTDICDLLSLEKTNDVYYDSKNVDGYLMVTETFPDDYPNLHYSLMAELGRTSEDIREDLQQDVNDSYKVFQIAIQDDILSEAIKHQDDSKGVNKIVLVNCEGLLFKKSLIEAEINGKNLRLDVIKGDLREIHTWISQNRIPQRKYMHNPKHYPNKGTDIIAGNWTVRKENNKIISELWGSEQEAEILLYKAIFNGSELHFFDSKWNKYIEFKYDKAGGWHGYHLYQQQEKQVPDETKEMLKKLV